MNNPGSWTRSMAVGVGLALATIAVAGPPQPPITVTGATGFANIPPTERPAPGTYFAPANRVGAPLGSSNIINSITGLGTPAPSSLIFLFNNSSTFQTPANALPLQPFVIPPTNPLDMLNGRQQIALTTFGGAIPYINAAGFINLSIPPSVTFQAVPTVPQAPTVVMGGLIPEAVEKSDVAHAAVPVLGEIPLLSHFNPNSKPGKTLQIFVTPHIIPPER